jgi:class 3 adenylate cyclase
LQEHGDRYTELLAEHHRLLREVWALHNGFELGVEGDAFFVAFGRAGDAPQAAQLALAPTGLKVRMGLHTGEPLLTEVGYVGIDVHRAARIAAAGHGGQVLLSQATRELVAADELRRLARMAPRGTNESSSASPPRSIRTSRSRRSTTAR